jgi:hypothetical protein
MQQNRLYLIIGALVVIVIGLGAYVIHERQKPQGVEIKLDQNGLSVQQN